MPVAASLSTHFLYSCHQHLIPLPHPNKSCSVTTTLSLPPTRLCHVWSYYSTANSRLQSPPFSVNKKGRGVEGVDGNDKLWVLKQKLELAGINSADSCIPGQYSHLLCPKIGKENGLHINLTGKFCKQLWHLMELASLCEGGKSLERSLSLHIIHSADFAMWRCYRTACGWAGQAFEDSRMTIEGVNKTLIVNSSWDREVKAEGIALEPLSEKLIAYFGERMIHEETLKRNGVMQMFGDQDIIAFTYRQNGVRVGCKYRTIEKRFWQETGTEKWLYGLDDINGATEIIIVEGEMDKLSVEEAGFSNCVSVPSGAPQIVSAKDLPPSEKDRAFQYLWNCKEYLEKISRIILATDGDASGQALAEELARRLGRERCWIVRWPKNENSSYFKDANEVLRFLGPAALREVIETAQVYQQEVLNQAV